MKPIILDENTLILDTETTGLGSDAEICEISIINGLGKVVFNCLIEPINPIPDEAIKIHGITNEMIKEFRAPKFEEIHTGLALHLAGKTLIIYNKSYDLKMISQVNKRCNFPEAFFDTLADKTICAMRYFSEFRNQAKWSKLTDACVYMGIDITQFKAHRALGDCQMTLELIRCMNDPQYIKTVKKKEIKNMESAQVIEKPQTAITTIEFDIKFTPSIINFDEIEFNNSVNNVIKPVKNLGNNLTKEVLAATLANLRKFQKQISDRRISIVKDIKAPITEFEKKIKKGDAAIEQYIGKYDAELKAIIAKEKVAKHVEIEGLLPNLIENNNLDKEHAAKLTILEDYYLVKWTLDKIFLDLDIRAVELFKQQDYTRVQESLKNTQIESRTRLIEQLNTTYNLRIKYAEFPINRLSDTDVEQYCAKLRTTLDAKHVEIGLLEQKQKKEWEARHSMPEEAEKQIPVIAPELSTAKIINHSELGNILYPSKSDNKIYQNLRLGASSQSEIIAAVARLKAAGLSVEFI